MFNRIVGSSNDGEIFANNIQTKGLIDTGSMITTISDSFYKSMDPLPELHNITEFGLSVQGANGEDLPFKGYIEAEISAPVLSGSGFKILLLIVSDTEYNQKVLNPPV